MKYFVLTIFLLSIITTAQSQTMTVKKAAFYDKTPALRDMEKITPGVRDRSWKDNVIRNEVDPRREHIDRSKETLPVGPDPLWQSTMGKARTNEPIQNFEGTPNVNSVYPPDTDGDVGPDHYYQMINLSFQIFDKEGNSLYGPADNSTIWDGFIGPWTGTNDGDPITLYDAEADRWLVSQFAINTSDGTYWELIAVSATGDPLGEYYRYAFQFPAFNDYPKLGIWNDAYYASFNMFGSYNRVAAAAFERDAILEGDPEARMVLFDLEEGSGPWSMLPADFDGTPPPEGTPNYFAYMQDDLFSNNDQIRIWEFEADWDNVENSTFEEAYAIDVAPFDSEICPAYRGRCIHQPLDAPQLEALADRLMFRLQYRNFGDYETMVTNHTVDVDGAGHAGIRWYEFRDYGEGWQLHQQGTYAPDSDHRWMGSAAMNEEGFIALGYSVSSNDTYPSIRYTGRGPNAPLGEMVFTEETIIDGTGVQTGEASRWGDYSKMSVDPTDNNTFWFTTEYMQQSGSVNWKTRIASFGMEEDFTAPDAVTDLAAAPPTTNGVWLSWTATTDNLGTPYLYDIRYDTVPVTEETWEEAEQAVNTPSPSPAGTSESFYIDGLDFQQSYYFALKVADRQYNYSALSNVANTTTPGQPNIVASEDLVEGAAYQGFADEVSYTLENNGESDIRFSLTKRDTLASVPGEILRTFANAGTGLLGMHFENDMVFLANNGINALMIYDTTAQVITDTVAIHDKPFGVTSDGEKLWIGSKSGLIKAYTYSGVYTGDSILFPVPGYHALAYDGTHLLLNKVNEDDPVIHKINPLTGQQEGTYQAEIGMDIWQSTWVEEHQKGKLWITNNDGLIAQLHRDSGSDTFYMMQQFTAPSTISYALSHTGTHILYANISNTIHLVDDGIPEVNWLRYEPLADTIAAGASRTLSLTMDAENFEAGAYFAYMTIHSNDVDQPLVDVPIQFTVNPYSPVAASIEALPEQICAGNSYELKALASGGTGDYAYSWTSSQQEEFPDNAAITVIPETDITYYLTVEDGLTATSDTVALQVQPSPQITLGADTSLCINHQYDIAVDDGYVSYQWHDGSNSATFTVDSTTAETGDNIMWLTVEGTNGCTTTDTLRVTMETCAGVRENALAEARIYPNPAKEQLHIVTGSAENVFIRITDVNGTEVYRHRYSGKQQEQHTVNVSPWSDGLYFVTLRVDGHQVVKKFIKQQ